MQRQRISYWVALWNSEWVHWLRLRVVAPFGTSAIVEDGGARATFGGKRYLLADYVIIYSKLRSLHRTAVLPSDELGDEVRATATLCSEPYGTSQITLMGELSRFNRNAKVQVHFSTLEEEEDEAKERDRPPIKRIREELVRRGWSGWPCHLDYWPDGKKTPWWLELNIPASDLDRILELSAHRGLGGITLRIVLAGLYRPETSYRHPYHPSIAYLLPKGLKIPPDNSSRRARTTGGIRPLCDQGFANILP